MGSTVFANKQGITSKNSAAMVMSPTDVCLTPAGNTQVPVPYTNIAKSGTLDKGSKTVKVDGAMGAIDGCCYKSSSGDQPGSGKGVMSGTVGDKAEFANCSFDVKIEGKGVCRNTDLMKLNNGNTIGSNQDSSASPPTPKRSPPPKDTVRIKVVEHLSWDAYDKKTNNFHLGHEDNKPIAGMKFKIKLPGGSIIEKTTDDQGIIELKDQDPHGKFEITFQPENAKLNSKHYLFSNGITPLEKKL